VPEPALEDSEVAVKVGTMSNSRTEGPGTFREHFYERGYVMEGGRGGSGLTPPGGGAFPP